MHFWDSNVWSVILICAILFLGMIIAYCLKNNLSFLKKSLVPASVLGGLIILIFTTIYQSISGKVFFELPIFSIVKEGTDIVFSGSNVLESITYHALGIGFIAIGLRKNKMKDQSKKRTTEIFNTGVTTVCAYLIQGILGLIVTIIAVRFFHTTGLLEAAGIILCFGYGQGTGQAMNYGGIYEGFGLIGGKNFGLTIAALGFLSASVGGVIYLNLLKKKGKISSKTDVNEEELTLEKIQDKNEITVNGSIDKFTLQLGIVISTYIVAFLIMFGLGKLFPSLIDTFYGFNFLFGTLAAVMVKLILNFFMKKRIIKREYINNFMMNRISGVAFDLMIVAGIAVINLQLIKDYWLILLILGLLGLVSTFFFIRFVSKKLFTDYKYEQFFMMYGMLTGTASTGVILLREIDPNLETPASDNLVYQNFPAIVFGFPIMLLASYAPTTSNSAYIVLTAITGILIVLLLILFRSFIFKKRKSKINNY